MRYMEGYPQRQIHGTCDNEAINHPAHDWGDGGRFRCDGDVGVPPMPEPQTKPERAGTWSTVIAVGAILEAPDAASAIRILSSRLAAAGFATLPATAEAKGAYPYPEYEVEVRKTVSTTTRVRAKNPLSAAKQVDDTSYPLPPVGDDWETVDDYTYTVRGPDSGPIPREILYEGNAQELS